MAADDTEENTPKVDSWRSARRGSTIQTVIIAGARGVAPIIMLLPIGWRVSQARMKKSGVSTSRCRERKRVALTQAVAGYLGRLETGGGVAVLGRVPLICSSGDHSWRPPAWSRR